ncbi:hypothetical protein PL263_15970 [Methylomonas sp. EFPC3]|uniref:TPM domain-containing protein n=1 Tax=Methylomonas sp. EFPC3 TaxID=3021710 RepID=UPI00241676D8|nr:hypothetical protein [Methylomonas sp. EFPC3]WFP49584.1 hypothetical protein PL263_15970 [Methylomonas sp. EFPC3]
MKQYLAPAYQSRLWDAIKSLENGSQAEAVVVFRARSGDYAAVPLLWGLAAAWLAFTLIMYAPVYFENWLVYYAPLAMFALAYGVGSLPAVKRCSVRRSTRDKRVEIMARAIFQKGGIQHTRDKTGFLVYCSLLERRVFLLPDRGLELAIPLAIWQELQSEFDRIFAERQPEQCLLQALEKTAAAFARYLPVRAGDINELPDRLDIDL